MSWCNYLTMQNNTVVGVGSGSTVVYAVERLSKSDLLDRHNTQHTRYFECTLYTWCMKNTQVPQKSYFGFWSTLLRIHCSTRSFENEGNILNRTRPDAPWRGWLSCVLPSWTWKSSRLTDADALSSYRTLGAVHLFIRCDQLPARCSA